MSASSLSGLAGNPFDFLRDDAIAAKEPQREKKPKAEKKEKAPEKKAPAKSEAVKQPAKPAETSSKATEAKPAARPEGARGEGRTDGGGRGRGERAEGRGGRSGGASVGGEGSPTEVTRGPRADRRDHENNGQSEGNRSRGDGGNRGGRREGERREGERREGERREGGVRGERREGGGRVDRDRAERPPRRSSEFEYRAEDAERNGTSEGNDKAPRAPREYKDRRPRAGGNDVYYAPTSEVGAKEERAVSDHKADKTAPASANPPSSPSVEVLGGFTKTPNRRERREKQREQHDRVSEDKGFVQPRSRAFERHSGTGRPMNDTKRKGAGKGNWGKLGSEHDADIEKPESHNVHTHHHTHAVAHSEEAAKEGAEDHKKEGAAPEAEKKEGADSANPPSTDKKEDADSEAPEKEVVTYDEYKKTHQAVKPDVSLPAPRRAGEGDKSADWSKFIELKKTDPILIVTPPKKKEVKKETPKESAKEGAKEGSKDAAAAAASSTPKTDDKKKQKKELVQNFFNTDQKKDHDSKKNRVNFDEKKGSPSQAPDRTQFPTLKETIKSAEPVKA